MNEPAGLGRILITVGLGLAAIGALLWFGQFLPPWLRLGRLPGDIQIQRPGFSFYAPLTTMILLSVVASAILWLLRWWKR